MTTTALLWLLGLAVLAQAAEEPTHTRRTISVTGQGEVRTIPDRVLLSFAVESTGARASEVATENAKRSTAVAAAVKALLDPADTVTTRYAVEPRYETNRPGGPQEPRITGYVVRNEILLESRRVDQVGALIDAATSAGANRIGSLQFSVSRRPELLRAAIEKAGADARAQAESAARGLGVTLKGVVSATTAAGPIIVPRRFEPMAMAEGMAAPTPVEPGESVVSAQLQVTYEIE